MNLPRMFQRLFWTTLLLAAIALVLMPWMVFSQDAAPAPADTGNPLGPILNLLAPVIAGLTGKQGWVAQVLLIIGVLRVAFKPVMMWLEQRAKDSPGAEDDERLASFERGPIYKAISFILDFGGSIKLPVVGKTLNQGTMKILSLISMAALVALMGCSTGCMTNAAGKRVVDISKLDDIKTIVSPIASRELRLALVRSPEHAVVLAPYIASAASVFCTMSLSNRFEPEFLLDELSKLSNPLLDKLDNGFAVDLKNGAYAAYKLLYGDRLHAEIPPDQWLHKVTEFFCETLNGALNDAGYPGGVKKTSADYRRDLNQRINLGGVLSPNPMREPESVALPTLRTHAQAPPVSDSALAARPQLPLWELSRR